ncbi:DNA replication initiation factor cdc45 [Cytospora paraplurivora]|uniref:DNA replication initiation factor cdc45 n=1 Tax=Cytospora paraplurivora TaxID=2898453 RepID=A0AAN9U0N5_9PEZI
MYLPRSLISKLYLHLQSTCHSQSPQVLILVALEPDALCGCRILTRLLKNDYIPHKIQPVAGYADLERIGREMVSPLMTQNGGPGGVVICLGVGGMVDLGTVLGLETEGEETAFGGVEVWVMDSRRPWNLGNVFGGFPLEPETAYASSYQARTPVGVTAGRIDRAYKPGKGGLVVFDDGDIEDELRPQRDAYMALMEMPDVEDNGEDLGDSDSESEEDGDEPSLPAPRSGQKRKSWSDQDEEDGSDFDDRPRQRRRSNSSTPIPDSPQRPKQRGLLSLQDQTPMSSDGHDEDPPTAAQPPKAPSARTLRRRLLRLRRQHENVLRDYYRNGTAYSEPISSMVYSLASELGREDNDILWLTIVGVTSMELYGRSLAGVSVPARSSGSRTASGWLGIRGAQIRQLLRDEVRRLNPPELESINGRVTPEAVGIIPTTARSPEDMSIRLSPEPRFLLIRHWSLYDSMLHSPYLFSRLKTYSETGLKRLHKLLAKMGVSLVQCKQSYAHMDIMLKRELRSKLLKYASLYNLDDMVPTVETDGKDRGGAKDGWGFVRSWGWRATLSAQDVGVVIGALLEVGKHATLPNSVPVEGSSQQIFDDADDQLAAQGEEWLPRFFEAYDALENIEALKAGMPTAQFLHKAIFNTGTALLKKKRISHLRAFRMCIVKDGAEAPIFNHPGALTKLALWIGEALAEQEKDATGKLAYGGRGTPLVVASLNEKRGVYIVVGTGGGGGPDVSFLDKEAAKKKEKLRQEKAKAKEESRRNKQKIRAEKRAAKRANRPDDNEDDDLEDETESEGSDASDSDSDSDSEDEDESRGKNFGLNRFGTAFQDVIAETSARVRVDSFEHCVVEVRKEDLSGFLESLSSKTVVS